MTSSKFLEAGARALTIAVALSLTVANGPAARAAPQDQGGQDQAGGRTETVVAGPRYGSAPGSTFFFGEDYRDLWTRPITVEILDLNAEAGGLEPVMRIGGGSSKGLALRGADGRDYTFRSVDKDMSDTIPVEFRDSVLVDIVQDQVAGNVPGVHVVYPPLARAAGVLTVESARLVVLPDDPALGEFRAEFAGVLGVFLGFPQPRSDTNPGSFGATEILDAEEFWERRQASTDDMADSRALLRARLLDLLINDWDRHRRQWRWARIPGEPRLQPVPEDPDMAFSDYEGFALGMARFFGAPFVKFENEYPPHFAATKNGWDVDRFLLTDIEREEWTRIAAEVQAALTDEVIESAISELPPEYVELRGAELVSGLRHRRDELTRHAEDLYRYMARDVDVHGSNANELATVDWLDGGAVQITVAGIAAGGTSPEPFYRRRFLSDETDEVRIYLHGGDDRFVVRGEQTNGIVIRAIGGPGNDVVDDSAGSAIRFYDSQGVNRIEGGNGTDLDAKAFIRPPREEPNDVPWVPDPDWGRKTTPILGLAYSADPGLVLGGGIDTRERSFRKEPWGSRHTIEGAWAFGVSKPYVDYVGSFRRENSPLHFELNARYSGIEQLRYYGLGNDTPFDTANDRVYDIDNDQAALFAALVVSDDRHVRFAIGPFARYSDSTGTDADTVLGQEQPLGFGEFGQVGLRAEAEFESRDATDLFGPGVELEANGTYNAELWDVEESYSSMAARFDVYHPLGSRLYATAFVGGAKVWGPFPYFAAAYLGNRTTTGMGWNRYAGDASLYGGIELDVFLARARLVVPGEVGISFFADAGRVYLEGEESNSWHPSYGVGVFYAPFRRTSLYGLKVGQDEDRLFVVFEARMIGFDF